MTSEAVTSRGFRKVVSVFISDPAQKPTTPKNKTPDTLKMQFPNHRLKVFQSTKLKKIFGLHVQDVTRGGRNWSLKKYMRSYLK
jgi:hypothetical protein